MNYNLRNVFTTIKSQFNSRRTRKRFEDDRYNPMNMSRAPFSPGIFLKTNRLVFPMNCTISQKLVFALCCLFGLYSCAEDAEVLPGYDYTQLTISLTDAPMAIEEVNIDLVQVVVKGDGQTEEIDLNTNAGIYNLLDYQNGLDTVIAGTFTNIQFINQIRLVLGDDNTVKVDGEIHELKVPSGSSSGLKIKVCMDLATVTQVDLLLDFDAEQSVKRLGNGKYMLKPVIRVMNPDAVCSDDDDILVSNLPVSIGMFLDANYGSFNPEAEQEQLCDGTQVYTVEAQGVLGETLVSFDLDGNLVQESFEWENDDLPIAVLQSIEMVYPTYEIANKTRRIARADSAIWYRVKLEDGDEELYVILDESGEILCEE